jgi:hypothetical protein
MGMMTTTLKRMKKVTMALLVGVVMCAATSAKALDRYQDRKGLFYGMGIGGGGAIRVPGADIGGEGIFDFQLGGGATSHLTLALDTDISVLGFENTVGLSIAPGPEITYFFGDTGLFIRVGLGAALNVMWVDGDGEFFAGLDTDLGFGWEFFANASFALGMSIEGGYSVLSGDDNALVGFMIGFKYY